MKRTRIGKNPTRGGGESREIPTFPVVVNGPHSNEICEILEGLQAAKAKGSKALTEAIEKVDLDVLLSKFEENHPVVLFSRTKRVKDDKNNVWVPGDVHRDEKGEPTLDPTQAGVWVGPRKLDNPSEDPEFADGKGRFLARLFFKSAEPRWLGGKANPPQIVNIDRAAKAEYEEFLAEERAAGIDIAATASQKEMAEESEAVTGGSAKVPSLRKPAAPKTTPPASS